MSANSVRKVTEVRASWLGPLRFLLHEVKGQSESESGSDYICSSL